MEKYKIDFDEQKVTVIGDVDREDVWRRIHKTGKRVTLIPKPPPPKVEPEAKEEKQEETKEETTEETKVEETTTEIILEENKQEKSDQTTEETKVLDTKEVLLPCIVITQCNSKQTLSPKRI
jgi:carbamoylphosphate synthase small subunit